MRNTIRLLSGSFAALLLLGGCAEWPRYLHMDDVDENGISSRVTWFEDETLEGDTLQDEGTVDPGTEVLFFGYLLECGYDQNADWPDWPLHDIDGTEIPLHSGWYTGDVDWITFTVTDDVTVEGGLEWVNEPPGNSNAPYRPDEPEGEWSTESDLDFVVFLLDGQDRVVENESGISNDYPENLATPAELTAGTNVALAIACHHNVASDYDLTLLVKPAGN